MVEVVTEQYTPEPEDTGQARGTQEDVSSLPRTVDDGEGNIIVDADEKGIQLIQWLLETEKPGTGMV